MFKEKHLVWILVICLSAAFKTTDTKAQSIVINEIMASNATTIADEDGDYEDWIELYNADTLPLNLSGYGLSDDYSNPFKWVFPEVFIGAGEHLLIWASGKDKSDPDTPLHTNFSISADGEEVLITHPSGNRMDELAPLPLPADISYGRQPDGADTWLYFQAPTPGLPNASQGFAGILDPPDFSHTAGHYTNDFSLSLSHYDPDVVIYYTIDGSVPLPENIGGASYYFKNQYPELPGDGTGSLYEAGYHTHIYETPFTIYDRSDEPDAYTHINTTWRKEPFQFPEEPVFKSTVVRARAYKDGYLPSPVSTSTFFVSPGDIPSSLNIVSLSCDPDILFDYFDGIYVAGVDFDNWRQQNPDENPVWPAANFMRRGFTHEFPMHFELFDRHGNILFNQAVGFRIHGGWSRRIAAKSFRLIARNRYSKNSLDYPFFFDRSFTSYNQVVLRNAGQDWPGALMRDAVFQHLVRHLNFTTQAYEPNIVFINGEYWGIKNFRERIDEQYLYRLFGIAPDEIDLLESNAMVIAGDENHYTHMTSFMAQNDLSQPQNFNYIKTLMDVDSFLDYFSTEIYSANDDWPGNNIRYWRKRTSTHQPDSPTGHDGRWRWMLFDVDGGFGHYPQNYERNSLAIATATDGPNWPNPPWSTLMLRSLLMNEGFKHAFINRTADLLNTVFMPWRIEEIVHAFKNRIEPEINTHMSRWNRPYSFNWWNYSVDNMIVFGEKRPEFLRQHFIDYFELEGETSITLDVSNAQHGYIRLNSVHVNEQTPGVAHNPYPWEGSYFLGVPVELEAIPQAGYVFSHWEGLADQYATETSITLTEPLFVKAHFEKSDKPELLYYWMFDKSMPNDMPLQELSPRFELPGEGKLFFHSALDGYPFFQGHPNWRKASMERRNMPTTINYLADGNNGVAYEASNMRGLQVKQPFTGNAGENTLFIKIPSTNYSNLNIRFAAINEGAASHLLVDYSASANGNIWMTEGLDSDVFTLLTDYQLFNIDLSNAMAVNNNPNLVLRIRFDGPNMTDDHEKRVTFNNISVEGTRLADTEENFATQDLWLGQNYPNPFTGETSITYSLAESGYVHMQVINLMGKRQAELVSAVRQAGTHHIRFQQGKLSPGVYIIVLEQNGHLLQRKMVITK